MLLWASTNGVALGHPREGRRTGQRVGASILGGFIEQNRKVFGGRKRVRMIGAKRILATLESPAVQGFCGRVVALITHKYREVINAGQRV
jgi:hypothetical protein